MVEQIWLAPPLPSPSQHRPLESPTVACLQLICFFGLAGAMVQSGEGTPRRRRSTRSTGCSSNKMHGIGQEYAKRQKTSKLFHNEKWRTTADCMPGVGPFKRRHKWSEEEDKILLKMVNLHGSKSWSTVSHAMPGRSSNQCRDRWTYYLDPSVNRHSWSEKEEIALIRAHQIYGNKWCELAKLFPGRTGKAVKNHWNSGMKKRLNSYLTRGLLEQSQNLPDDTPVLNSRDSSALNGNEDPSLNKRFSSDLCVRPKSEHGLTETGKNATTLDGKFSDSVSAKGFGARSGDDPQKVVCQMDTSMSPVVTNNKMAFSTSSVDLKVCDAAPSFVMSMLEEKQTSSSCPAKVLPSCANRVLSPAHSSQSTGAHFDEICRGADKELAELHQADIAELLDMSYCESLMIIPPDSLHHI